MYQAIIKPTNKIGKGMFSIAYRDTSNKTRARKVYIVSDDPAKECIALFCNTRKKHIPSIKRLECEKEGKAIYEMPYYFPIRASLHPVAWKQYRELEHIFDVEWSLVSKHDYGFRVMKAVNKSKTLPKALKEAVVNMIENMYNYTDKMFLEISPRNIKVDSRGNLILLDIMGCINKLHGKY